MTHNIESMDNVGRFWNESVGYIIYPETFKDGNGDGVGDLLGIISELDYLRDLGVNLLWICPIFSSPMDDNGYDVSDYMTINPMYGTNEDFKKLLDEAHKRGIRIIIDFVLNHTSDEHPWFKKALEDPNSEERSYYFFRKGRREGDKILPPNNWKGFFSTSVWKQIGDSDDFYFHIFSEKMPDVDWSNPKLRQRYFDTARHYLELGVDGFRLDAVAHLAKDTSFENSSLPCDENGLCYDTDRFSNRPELFDYLHEFKREVFSKYPCFTIGEVGGGISAEKSLLFSDRETGCIDEVFNFDTAWCNGAYGSIDKKDDEIKTDVLGLKRSLKHWYDTCHARADMPLYWCNHDHPRVLSQYGSTQYRAESAKALFTTLLFMYGTPFIYQGDEIGMSNVNYTRPEDFFRDVGNKNEVASLRARGYNDEQITHYLNRVSRVNARTPMQWTRGHEAGFTEGENKTNKINDNYLEGVNVLDEMNNPWSILNFYQYAIWKRRSPEINNLIQNSRFQFLDMNHPDVVAYMHEGSENLVVIASFRPYQTYFSFYWAVRDVLLHNYADVILQDHVFTLRPFECFLLKV
ncbi:MAG: alpha-glucosidase [Erysipelotrichaceae bacterium]|nr:alpha-glucosidase [Erysipelotrichaceae bacterium]